MSTTDPEVENPTALDIGADTVVDRQAHDDDFDKALARHKANRESEAAATQASKNMWRTHHWPEQYDRCAVVRGRHVCRRCVALHPLSIVIAVLAAAGYSPWPVEWDPWPIWLLSLPATADFIIEQLDLLPYNPKRQVAATLITAFAFGRALGYEITEQWTPEFWGPVAVFGGIWFAVAFIRHRSDRSRLLG